MTPLPRSLVRWLNASIGNRFSAVLLALTVGFMVFVGSGNFFYLLQLTQKIADDDLAEEVRDASEHLGRTLTEISEDNRLLANNPTVVSAVLDTRGQETYINPLLASFRPAGRSPVRICVTDYRSRAIGCQNAAQGELDNSERVVQTIEANLPTASVKLQGPNRPTLQLVTPVRYEGTGTAEGAVVATYDLAPLLKKAVGNADRYAHIHLKSSQNDLFLTGQNSLTIHAGRTIETDQAFQAIGLQLSLGIPTSTYYAPILRLMAAYSLMALLLVAAAFWAARKVVPTLIARLADITDKANQVAEGKAQRFDAAQAGADEIGQLARAFQTMTERLNETNEGLEQLVEVRTNELIRQEAMLHAIIDAVPGAIFQFRRQPDGRFSLPFASHSLPRLYGLEGTTLNDDASPMLSKIHPDDLPAHLASIEHSFATMTPWQTDFRVSRPNGDTVWLRGNALPKQEGNGAVLWHGVISDITEYKRAELALSESEAYSKTLFEHSYIPLVIMDPQTGQFIDCNDAAVTIYRLGSRQDVLGKTPLNVSTPEQYDGTSSDQAAREHIQQAQTTGLAVFQWRHQRPDGEVWDAEVRLMHFRHGGRDLMQFSLIDITEQKRSEIEIWRKANFDPLTGLANRNLCQDRLERALARARRSGQKVGVFYIDLDGFKAVNDTLGHAAGDQLLVDSARRLESCIREQDTAARLGGDEFVLIVQDIVDRADLKRVADDALRLLSAPFALDGGTRQISCSLGIAVFPEDANSLEALLEAADQALYKAKRAGKNRYRLVTGD